MCCDAAWERLHSLIRDLSQACAVSASEWLCWRGVPPGISLAAELMSMSADDWAASRSAADVGRLSRPLLDYFASSSSSSSGAQL